jgi:hypothetical protein
LKARPGFVAGLAKPERFVVQDTKDPKELERIAKEASAWIMKGMADDKKKP